MNRHCRQFDAKRRGAALLLSLVMITLLSVIVMEIAIEVRMAAERVANDFFSLQAEYAARSGVTFALALLQRDLVQDRLEIEEYTGETLNLSQLTAQGVDSLDEEWAAGIKDFDLGETGDVSINLYVSDLPGRINLNSLVSLRGRLLEEDLSAREQIDEESLSEEEQEEEATEEEEALASLDQSEDDEFLPVEGTDYAYNLRVIEATIRLFSTLQIFGESDLPPEELVANIIDWIDPDSEPFEGVGAEDDYYMSLPIPYQAKNWFMASLDELLLIKGFTPEMVYGTRQTPGLIEYVGVVRGIKRRLNINTATPEVIETWIPDLPPGIGEEVVQARMMAPFENQQDLRDRVPGLKEYNRFRFNSQIFLIVAEGICRNSKVTIIATVSRQIEQDPAAGMPYGSGGFGGGAQGGGFGGGLGGGATDSNGERVTFRTLTYRMIT